MRLRPWVTSKVANLPNLGILSIKMVTKSKNMNRIGLWLSQNMRN